jgi:hypothetical protein
MYINTIDDFPVCRYYCMQQETREKTKLLGVIVVDWRGKRCCPCWCIVYERPASLSLDNEKLTSSLDKEPVSNRKAYSAGLVVYEHHLRMGNWIHLEKRNTHSTGSTDAMTIVLQMKSSTKLERARIGRRIEEPESRLGQLRERTHSRLALFG